MSAGSAGAGMASGHSAFDGSMNPASLIHLFGNGKERSQARHRLELIGRMVQTETDLADAAGTAVAVDQGLAVGPWLAYAAPLGEGVVWSLAFQPTLGVDFTSTRMTDLNIVTLNSDGSGGPAQDEVPMSTQMLQVALEPSLAWRASPSWSFGLGVSLRNTTLETSAATELGLSTLDGPIPESLSALFGEMSWGELILDMGSERGVDSFQTEFTADADSGMPTLYLKFGASWEPDAWTRVGFWYRPQSTSTDMEGSVDVDLSADLGVFISGLEDTLSVDFLDDPTSSYDFNLSSVAFPRQAGVSYSRLGRQQDRWNARAVWTDWSSAFTDWTVHLTNPSNPEFVEYLGGDGSVDVDLGLRWKDTYALSVGYERHLSPRLTVRGGCGWSNNPVGGAVLGGVVPYNSLHAGLGLSYWRAPGDLIDWHAALTAALPEKWTAGENTVLSDLSGDVYDQQVWALLVACTLHL